MKGLVRRRRYMLGFTLIELLVVIAIIGILATIINASFSESRALTRDKARQSALQEMALALEFYRAQHGMYPPQGCLTTNERWAGVGATVSNQACESPIHYALGLTPDFIDSLPVDPNDEGDASQGFMYQASSTAPIYKLVVKDTVEVNLITDYSDEYARCPAQCGTGACSGTVPDKTYAVYSLGAECW